MTTDRADQNLRFFEFHPDNQGVEVMTPCQVNGKVQLMRDGTVYFTAAKPRTRANSTLLRKAAHGRLSATKDRAVQLTLKCFKVEAINWPRAFVRETVSMLTDVMGAGQMADLLSELLNGLKEDNHGN